MAPVGSVINVAVGGEDAGGVARDLNTPARFRSLPVTKCRQHRLNVQRFRSLVICPDGRLLSALFTIAPSREPPMPTLHEGMVPPL